MNSALWTRRLEGGLPSGQVRPCVAADHGACIDVFRSNLPCYFDFSELPEFQTFLERPIGEYFVVALGGAVVACGGCYVRNGIGYLSWGMVAKEFHRRSVGTMLLGYRVNRLFSQPDTFCITIDTSQHSAGFFARFGFRTTQQIADGFGMGIDQVSMSLMRGDWVAQADVRKSASPLNGITPSP